MNNLVIITGPTAVGKTEISIELAKAINGEIISADSIQVYKYMDIGSAKIKKEEMQGIKHYLIDEFEPDDEFNVNVFQKLTKKYINEIYEKEKTFANLGCRRYNPAGYSCCRQYIFSFWRIWYRTMC